MAQIPVEVKNLKQLHEFLNNGDDHTDVGYSQAALVSIRDMVQPCPNTGRDSIQSLGALVGDNVTDTENVGSVTICCTQAITTPSAKMDDKKSDELGGVTCNVTGRKCDMCLPKPRKSGTALIIVS